MMKTSALYMELMRRRASENLPPAFPRQVLQRAIQRRAERVRLQIAAVTALLCVATAVSIHHVRTTIAQRTSLAAWSETAAQARVLEESI